MPDEFLLGRAVATDIVDPETGEIVMRANDELTEDSLGRLRAANIHEFRTLYTNDLDAGPFISQTLRLDDSADQISARIAIYRMMRPGEPPTEDAVEALFNRLFYNEDTYDLSRVGRMKFNSRVGREEPGGHRTARGTDQPHSSAGHDPFHAVDDLARAHCPRLRGRENELLSPGADLSAEQVDVDHDPME